MLETDKELFDRIAESYGAKDLHPASRIARRQRLLQSLGCAHLASDADLLEVGCGAGFAADYLQGCFRSFLGLDYSDKLIECARQRNGGEHVQFLAIDLAQFRPAERFDAIFMIGVLHHMDDPATAVRQMADWLHPGGWLIANEPLRGNPVISWARRMRKATDDHYSTEQKELTATELRGWMRSAGFQRVETRFQGVFSTPFAEVMLQPAWLMSPLAAAACWVDRAAEKYCQGALSRLAWNVIVAARKGD